MNIQTIAERYPLKHETIKLGKDKVEIKTFLPVEKFVEAVYTVVSNCFTDDEYRPEYRPIAENYMVVSYLTDIEIGDVSATEVFKISQANWFNEVMSVVGGTRIYNSIMESISEIIDYRIRTKKTGFDKLCESFTSLSEGYDDEKMAEVKELLDKLGKVDKSEFISAVLEQPYSKDEVDGKKS